MVHPWHDNDHPVVHPSSDEPDLAEGPTSPSPCLSGWLPQGV